VIIPVVAECDDSFLNEAARMQVAPEDVAAALREARVSAAMSAAGAPAPPAEGAVGSGTGMSCLGFKGGIGTASRVLPDSGHTIGVLTMTNFGDRERLTVAGVPVGRLLPRAVAPTAPAGAGSCIVVVLTDAPISGADCRRIARRAGLGLARTGSVAYHGSGEIFIAASTTMRTPRGGAPTARPLHGIELDPFFAATVDATEEAVLNSLLQAPTVTGRAGNTSEGLPAAAVAELLATYAPVD